MPTLLPKQCFRCFGLVMNPELGNDLFQGSHIRNIHDVVIALN